MSLAQAVQYLTEGNWEQAHALVDADESAHGMWAHGIVHLQEGDLDNARYWYERAQRALPSPIDIQAEVRALARALAEPGPAPGA